MTRLAAVPPRNDIGALSSSAKSIALALSVVQEHVRALSKADLQDFLSLYALVPEAGTAAELDEILETMAEILAQSPATIVPEPAAEDPAPDGLTQWMEYAGKRLREVRERVGLTRDELAAKSGLPATHIARLENATHSATRFSLEKIAAALGVPVAEIDPT